MILQDYFNQLESDPATSNSPVLSCKDIIYKTFHEYKKMLPRSEYEDLQADILVIVLEAEATYDPVFGASFLTYLFTCLKRLSHDFLTKYTGIKVSSHMKQVIYPGQKIYINKIEFKEEEYEWILST